MSTATRLRSVGDRLGVDRVDLLVWTVVVLFELLLVLTYLAVTSASITEPRYVVYPFVWINVGLLAVSRTTLADRSRRVRVVALAVAGAYLLALLAVAGLVRFGVVSPVAPGTGLRVSWVVPGWGPVVVYRSAAVQLVLVPFELVGYAAVAYLLYARLLDAVAGVLSGLLGLVSCVGCTFSLLTPVAGVAGFGAAVVSLSWDLSTLVFLLTVALLYWAPEIGRAVSARLPTR
ncbi:MAG: hypothetical protein ABEH47_04925 [Haloferacaceae archaeon]